MSKLSSVPKPLKLVMMFFFHILTGLLLFAGAAIGAVSVTYFGRALGGDGVSYYVMIGFNALGLLLFAADLICAFVFTGVQATLFIKDLYKYFKKAWKEE